MRSDLIDPIKKLGELEPAKKVLSLYDEFKTFAFKGNIVDLAVAFIIGTAFSNLVNALVKQIIMPFVNVFMPSQDAYANWEWDIDGKKIPYGAFLGEVINFLVVTLAMFLFVVKFLGWILRLHKQEAVAVPELTKDQQLLTEIRDLLKTASLHPETPARAQSQAPQPEKSQP